MTDSLIVPFLRLQPDKDKDIPLPQYMSPLAAGMDIHSANETDIILSPGSIHLIPTGFAMALPRGFEAQIRPRSGLAVKHGVTIINSPGTIDADYRGEVKVGLINLGAEPYTVKRKERIAQMVIQPVVRAETLEVKTLEITSRDGGGFGSTGK